MSEEASGETIGEMADEFLERLREGEKPSVDEFKRRRPDLASAIDMVLPALIALEAASPSPVPPPNRGMTIGDYHLVREIGRGGMGVVYEAIQDPLGRRVALKLMSQSPHRSPQAMERFKREAAIAGRIAHPGLCVVHDAGVVDGVPFIAMALIDGVTLAERIESRVVPTLDSRSTADSFSPSTATMVVEARRPPSDGESPGTPDVGAGPLAAAASGWTSSPPASADEIASLTSTFEKVALALDAAHRAGIVHRDIKPGNIMITRSGEPVLMDFGLARDTEAESGLTAPDALVGTPPYLAPEQLKGQSSDIATDVYALGVSLYEALTGDRPFRGATRELLYRRILEADPRPVRDANPAVSRDLAAVVHTAMSRDRDRRYATAGEFAADLECVRHGIPVQARTPTLIERAARYVLRRPLLAALVASLLIMVTVSALFTAYWITVRDDVAAARQETERREIENLLARTFLFLGDDREEESIPGFEEALRRAPSDEAVVGLALALHQSRRFAEAIEVLDRYEAITKGAVSVGVIRAAAEKELAPTTETRDTAFPPPTTRVDHFVQGLIDLAKANRGDAVSGKRAYDSFTESLAAGETVRQVHHILRVRAAGTTGDAELLERSIVPLAARWPESPLTWFAVGMARQMNGNPQGAGAAFARVVDITPKDVEAWAQLADARRRSGQIEEARAAVRRALEIGPRHHSAMLAAAIVEDSVGGDADELYRRVIEVHPSNVVARTNLARLARQAGRIGEALKLLEEAVAIDAKAPLATYMLAVMTFESGDRESGLDLFRRAIELAPTNGDYHHALSTALHQVDEIDEAIVEARRAFELDPDDAEIACNYGALLVAVSRFAPAITPLRRALEIQSDLVMAQCLLGRSLLESGAFEEALPHLQRGLANPLLPDAYREQVKGWRDRCEDELDQ